MILFVILLMIALILTGFVLLTISLFGAGFIIVFGDVIVCIFIIAWIMKKIFGKNKKK